MYRDQTVAIVIPARNEEDCIASVVGEFRSHPAVDHVLVVDNASEDRTTLRARAAGAHVVHEERRGYGSAIRAGLDASLEAGWRVAVVTEADGSFRSADLEHLLEALEGRSLVLGTRTDRGLLLPGANMDELMRWGNVALAKFLKGLFAWRTSSASLSDVGCTYRAMSLTTWGELRRGLPETGPEFSPAMICEALERGIEVRERPVRYGPRCGGRSKHSAGRFQALRTGLAMFRTICRKRLAGRVRSRAAS